jgi:transcriptional regulator with XRE-family HTH domain
MTLTDFGKTVRKARIDSGQTLLTMAEKLDTTPAFLSGMETGRKKIPMEWVGKITEYFKNFGISLDDLEKEAYLANKTVPLDSLNYQHQLLVAGFAKSNLSQKQLIQFAELLDKFQKNSKGVRVEK